MSSVPASGSINIYNMQQEFGSTPGSSQSLYDVWARYRTSQGVSVGNSTDTRSMSDFYGKARGAGSTAGSTLKGGTSPGDIYMGMNFPFSTLYNSGGFLDDGYYAVTLPFPWYINGTGYTTAYCGSNGYITFGSGFSYTGASTTSPNVPKICMGAQDSDLCLLGGLNVSTGYGGTVRAYCIRFEGSSVYGSNSHDRIVEVTFFATEHYSYGPYQVVQINYGPWAVGGFTSIDNGSTQYLTWTQVANLSFLCYLTGSGGTGGLGAYRGPSGFQGSFQ
jgi:hypothetical protein